MITIFTSTCTNSLRGGPDFLQNYYDTPALHGQYIHTISMHESRFFITLDVRFDVTVWAKALSCIVHISA